MINHLGVIMDGNRRWATKRNLMSSLGHLEGVKALNHLIEFCLESKINYVSVYTFSLENFNRSPQEIEFLFKLLIDQSNNFFPDFIKNKIKVRFIGNKLNFPDNIKPVIKKLEEATQEFNDLVLNIILCYGGQQEIISAIKLIAQDVKNNVINPEQITDNLFDQYLWTKELPEPELIIRTGGALRLSNFLLYKAAYSEFYFTNCLWPDLTKKELQKAVQSFEDQKRNFGS